MKINPQTAPLYGECLLTVQLSEEEREDEEDVEFYLMFTGTTQRHLTTTLRVSHVTLQAVCPAHDRGETVQVTLCQARPGGAIDPVAEDHFQFVQDLALDMAHFLVKAAAHKDGLEGAMLLDECHIPLQECERLDETLALALRHLPLPTGWSVLGTDLPTQPGTERGPHDTLLHFAARRGLRRVALFLLQQPGGRDALHFTNQQGHTPARLAQKRGHAQLQHLLSEIENSPRPETKATRRRVPGGRVLLHHPVLNTYTLTVDRQPDAPPPDLRADVEELQRLIGSHCGQKGVSLTEQPTVSLILSRDLCDDLPLGVETSCVGPTSPRTLGPDREEEISSPSARSSDAVGVGTHAGPYPNGTVEHDQSEEADPAVAGSAVEGCGGRVPGGSSQERVAVGAASCATQQLEEADNEPGVAPSRRPDLDRPVANHSRAESQVRKTIQSDCELEGIMGQSHGLLPTAIPQGAESETGDLPGEREGEDTVPSTAAPHTGLPEDSGRAEETRRCAGGAENSPSDGTIASRAGQETGPCSEAVQQAVESRKEDPGNRGDPTDDCSCGPEAPASARTRRELEESLAEGLQPNMVSGPDPNAVRDASPQPLCLPVSSAAPVEQHQIDLPPVDTAPQGLEHTSTSDLSNDVTSSDVTGKAGHRDDGGLYSVLNEEKRPTLSASEPHDVISVFSGEEKCSDGKPVGQAPPSQNDPYERETGSESRPATGLSSTPARDEAVVGETPSAGKEEAARSETEPCQDIHTTSTAGQQPDRAEPPSPPSGVDPTLGHPTPSVDHVCRSQAGPAGSRPGVTEDSGVRETEAMEETRVTEVTEENKMTEEPGVTEEIGEECVNLPTAPIAVPAGGCERKETSAPPCDRPPSPPSCHEPQSEVVTSSVTSGVPVERETTVSGKITVSDGPVSCLNTSSDSGVTLDSTFASDPLSVSTQVLDPSSPLDVDSGTALHMDTSSPLEVNSGSAQDLPPSHNDGNLDGACESKSPEEDTSPPTVERVEGPPEDQLTDEPSDSTSGAEGDPQISFKHMDQSEGCWLKSNNLIGWTTLAMIGPL
ncbi:uncharacterized protein LOC143527259 isoform X2 [Brachyhypopomus gauderio]|uniref:uncharacterized protein LOC143527259 isoform X2 n=1 Tax=Brachyhypopomus gauderio TaxID=698409 RepID=UPI004041510A